MSRRPPILILHATGTNRDREAAWACELAGGAAEIVHINRLIAGEVRLADYRMLILPGGFSYGDDLGAGKLWAIALRYRSRWLPLSRRAGRSWASATASRRWSRRGCCPARTTARPRPASRA